MSIKLQPPEVTDLKPRLTVIGVGGAGCNAVNNMISAGLTGVDFVVANTDAQALSASSAEHRLQLGANLTEGLGAGAKPEVGEKAAIEAVDEIRAQVSGSHMVFIAAGMGGGTGTGAASVIAKVAREQGILTVGVVTKPFLFEGSRRMRIAEAGIEELRPHVDTLIVIPNQNLFLIANDKTTFAEAFVLADQVLYSGVACIVDLIIKDGLINLDFADVRAVMSDMGTAMMGTGEAKGERRSIVAAEEAIANPLLDDVSLRGARGLLLSIIGGPDLTLVEVDEAAMRVRQEVDPEANIIVGATFDESLGDRVRVSIVASGMPRLGPEQMPARGGQRLRGEVSGIAAGMASAASMAPMAGPPGATSPSTAPMDLARPAHKGRPPLDQSTTADVAVARSNTPSGEPAVGTDAPPADDHPDLQQRLYEAMLNNDQPGSEGSDVANSGAEQSSSAETWLAPGNVLIEEGATDLERYGSAQPPQVPSDIQRSQVNPDHFEPMPPNEVRRAPPRTPEVGDFSPIAQREYHAKTGRGPAPQGGGTPSVGYPHHAQEQSAKPKRGLFGLFRGLGRRKSDSPQTKRNLNSAPSHEHSVAGARPDDARQLGNSDSLRPTAPEGEEAVELPVFFNVRNKA